MVTTDQRNDGKTLLRQCQLAELYLFDVFLELCRKHGLTYFVYGGTLLGAVRHKGFIPWDDDIDVAMPLKDYRRFLKIAQNELPSSLLVTPSHEYGDLEPFAKIRERYSFFCEKETNVTQPCGIYIDIFPYEKAPVLPEILSFNLVKWCALSWLSAKEHRVLVHRSVLGIFYSGVKAVVWTSIYLSLKYLQRLLALVLPSVWRSSPGVPFFYAQHIGFSDDVMFPLRTVTFEGRECLAPNDVDSYLTQYYGDWRKLPPPEKRQWHASIICPTQAPDAPWAMPYENPACENRE